MVQLRKVCKLLFGEHLKEQEKQGNDRKWVFGNRIIWVIWLKKWVFSGVVPFPKTFCHLCECDRVEIRSRNHLLLKSIFQLAVLEVSTRRSAMMAVGWLISQFFQHGWHLQSQIFSRKSKFGSQEKRLPNRWRDWSYMHEGSRQLHPLRSFCHSERQSDCRSPTHKRDWETMQVFRCPRNHGSWNLQQVIKCGCFRDFWNILRRNCKGVMSLTNQNTLFG